MSQQMFGGGAGLPALQAGYPAVTAPAANPMAAMMQQMMSDPTQMQQAMAMSQQMGDGLAGSPFQQAATTCAQFWLEGSWVTMRAHVGCEGQSQQYVRV